jgi:hypothetical protein
MARCSAIQPLSVFTCGRCDCWRDRATGCTVQARSSGCVCVSDHCADPVGWVVAQHSRAHGAATSDRSDSAAFRNDGLLESKFDIIDQTDSKRHTASLPEGDRRTTAMGTTDGTHLSCGAPRAEDLEGDGRRRAQALPQSVARLLLVARRVEAQMQRKCELAEAAQERARKAASPMLRARESGTHRVGMRNAAGCIWANKAMCSARWRMTAM